MTENFKSFLVETAKTFKIDSEKQWQQRTELSRQALTDITCFLQAYTARGDMPFIDKMKELETLAAPRGQPYTPTTTAGDLKDVFSARIEVAQQILSKNYDPPSHPILIQHHLETVNLFFQFGPHFLPENVLRKMFLPFDFALLSLLRVQAMTCSELYRKGKDTARTDGSAKSKKENAARNVSYIKKTYKDFLKMGLIKKSDKPYSIAKIFRENGVQLSKDTIIRRLKDAKIF